MIPAQKTRKHFQDGNFRYVTLSEIAGGGGCQNLGFRLNKVYVPITPLKFVKTWKNT